MKNIKKIVLTILIIAIVSSNVLYLPVVAANEKAVVNVNIDMYSQKLSESVTIDGVTYVYEYSYTSDGNRSISITDTVNLTSDVVIYDELSSTLLLNGEVIGRYVGSLSSPTTSTPNRSWRDLSYSTYYISWALGTTAAIAAGCIAAALGFIGGPAVIIAIGATAMGILAAATVGGTIHVTFQEYHLGGIYYQYRNAWSFTSSNGDYYGLYYHLI